MVSQTTFKRAKYEDICEVLKKKFAFVLKFDTICNATVQRQSEAENCHGSRCNDRYRGKNSLNTQKLFEICKENCSETYLIENADELPLFSIKMQEQ